MIVIVDINGYGFISLDEIKIAIKNTKQNLTNEEINEIISQEDIDKDGKISYEEYVKFMLNT